MTDCPYCSGPNGYRVRMNRAFVVIDSLKASIAELQAALDFEVSRRTLGGTPPAVDENWANVTTAPPSADDDSMPAHRRVELRRSDD